MIPAGSKVLFIAPKFFGYEQEIKKELELAGCTVRWFDDRPASTPLVKALIRFRPELIAAYSDQYFDQIIKDAAAIQYDVIFVIKGEALSVERLQMLKQSQPQARFLYYSWDSLKNFKNSHAKLACFDKVYSFDSDDCQQHPQVQYLPLFYIRAYEELAAKATASQPKPIDLLFLGSIHSDRYPVIQRVWQAVRAIKPDSHLYEYFFYQSKWVFALRKLFDPQFRQIPWETVRWDSLSASQTLALIADSQIIVDVHHPGQKGLTMRTIESLGAEIKLITTNDNVTQHDFFDPNNILVIDRVTPVIPAAFLQTAYKKPTAEIYNHYSLRAWLTKIFADERMPLSNS